MLSFQISLFRGVYIGQVVLAEATTSVLIIYINFKSDLSLCFSITIVTFN